MKEIVAISPVKRGKGRLPGDGLTYSQEVADEILRRLSIGEPLSVICEDPSMPAVRTVYDWRDREELAHFAAALARARREGFDAIAANCLKIADDGTNDTIETEKGEKANSEWIARSKLRVDTRLRLLAVWDPTRYAPQAAQTNVNVGVAVQVALPEDVRAKIMELRRAGAGKVVEAIQSKDT